MFEPDFKMIAVWTGILLFCLGFWTMTIRFMLRIIF